MGEALSRHVYDPFDPPTESALGYKISDLAHICRSSQPEIEYAVKNRVFGAENALAMPPFNEMSSIRYGILSEEGRQTISTAILSVLLECNLDLMWKFSTKSSRKEQGKGMQISLLLEEIRSHWQRVEGAEISHRGRSQVKNPYCLSNSKTNCVSQNQSQFCMLSQAPPVSTSLHLPDKVIWHCLRSVVDSDKTEKDTIRKQAHLLPDEVAKLAAHHVFLGSKPRSSAASKYNTGFESATWWEEDELVEEWSMRLPGIEPRIGLLKGIAISEIKEADVNDAQQGAPRQTRLWQYSPEIGPWRWPSMQN